MSIRYSSGTGAITFENAWTQSSGTKTELCNKMYADFIASGWASAAVTGSAPNVTAFTVTSAATPTAGLQCQVKADTSGTNCVHLVMQTAVGSNVQTGGFFLLPAASKVWYMVFNPFQFFVWQKGAPQGRDVAMGGCPYIPTFLDSVVTVAIWGQGNGTGDTGGNNVTFRSNLCISNNSATNPGNAYNNVNGTWWEYSNATSSATNQASPSLLPLSSAAQNYPPTGMMYDCRWYDGSILVSDAIYASGILAGASGERFLIGQIWDAFLTNDWIMGDQTISYDTHNYIAFTNFNYRSGRDYVSGTLWIATS